MRLLNMVGNADVDRFMKKAKEHFDSALKSDNTQKDDHLRKSAGYASLWLEVAQTRAERIKAQHHLALVYYIQGKYVEAKHLAESILAIDAAHFHALRILFWLACDDLSSVRFPDPKDPSLTYIIARTLVATQDSSRIQKRITSLALEMKDSYIKSWSLPSLTGAELLDMTDTLLNDIAPRLEKLKKTAELKAIYESILKAPFSRHLSSLDRPEQAKAQDLHDEARGALSQLK